MRIYLIEAVEGHLAWEPEYDKTVGAVVRARTEQHARSLLADGYHAGDEGDDVWLDPEASSCAEIGRCAVDDVRGPGVLIVDRRNV